MRIDSVFIEGFKSLRHFWLDDVPDLVVLVGPNGAGKSSVLEAIGLLKDWVGAYGNSRSMKSGLVNPAFDTATIDVRFQLSDLEVQWLKSRDVVASPDRRAQISIRGKNLSVDHADPGLKELFSIFAPNEGLGVFEHLSPYRSMSVDGISSMDVQFDEERYSLEGMRIFEGRRNYGEIFRRMAVKVLGDFVHYRTSGETRDSTQFLRDLFTRLLAPKELVGPEVSTAGVHFRVKTADGEHPLQGLSAGEKEVFAVFATLYDLSPRSSVLLYDTPETHLNGSIERRVANEAKRFVDDGNQIFLCTHSLEFIDATGFESLFHIGSFKSANQVQGIESEASKIRVFESLGASLGIQLISSTVVFIEGVRSGSDKTMIQAMLPDIPTSVTLLPGKRVTTFMEAAGLSTELMVEGTKYTRFFAIRDRDYLTDEQRNEFMTKYPNLIILDRYHIENYLLSPTAISVALENLGIEGFSVASIQSRLVAISARMKEQAAVDWAAYQLNSVCRSLSIGGGSEDALHSLIKSASASLERLETCLAMEEVRRLVEQRLEYVESKWDTGVWKTEFPGRKILSQFVSDHVAGINSKRFTHLVANAIGEADPGETSDLRTLLRPILE